MAVPTDEQDSLLSPECNILDGFEKRGEDGQFILKGHMIKDVGERVAKLWPTFTDEQKRSIMADALDRWSRKYDEDCRASEFGS